MTDTQFATLDGTLDSAGSKTTPGKQRTRLNAYRHGLTGQIRPRTAAEQAAFDAHCKGIVQLP